MSQLTRRVGFLRIVTALTAANALAAPHPLMQDALAGYTGKYKDDPRLDKQVGEIEKQRTEALAVVAERLGLKTADAHRIRIELRDALSEKYEKLTPFTGRPFQTRSAGEGGALIVLHTEFLVNGRFDVPTELRHEMVHAVMRAGMAPAAYGAVPVWLREGLAVWAAGQTEDKARWLLRQEDFLSQPDRAIQGLPVFATTPAGKNTAGADTGDEPGGSAALRRYPEYAFAIDYLADSRGEEAVRKLALSLVKGTPARDALEEASGQTWEVFSAAARQYAVSRLAKLRPSETDAYAKIVQRDHARQYAEVEKWSADFLKANPDSTLRGNVLYFRGKANRLQKKAGAAESALKQLLEKPARSDYVEKALYQLTVTRVEAGRHADAVNPCLRLLRDHPDSDVLDRALYYLALCRSKAGNRREALRLLDVFDRSFPGSEVASKARELRESLEKAKR